MSLGRAFRNGGWVLLLAGLLVCALLVWALGPAVLRSLDRPPGDGSTVESFAFDLSNERLPQGAQIEVAMAHRDLVPVLSDPVVLTPQEIARANTGRSRYLVSDDLVIGVEFDGHARAYPISVLNVHELVNDTLGNRDIAVTWHWPSAATAVFDRTIDGAPAELGVSGLVAGGNMLVYARHRDGRAGGEALYSQALGTSVTGPPVALTPVESALVRWADWYEAHPETTVIAPLGAFAQRYKKGKPDAWMASSALLFDTPLPDHGPAPKDRVMVVRGPDGVWAVPVATLTAAGGQEGRASIDAGGVRLTWATRQHPDTATLLDPPPGWRANRAMWVTAHLLHPDVTLVEPAR